MRSVDSSSRGARARVWKWTAVLAGLGFTLAAVDAARLETPTVDEFAHLPAGCAYWEHGSFELYAKNPPLMQLLIALPVVLGGDAVIPRPESLSQGWGPWIYGYRFMEANADQYFRLFLAARLTVVLLVLVTGALIFRWSRQLFGDRAAAVVTVLFFLSPSNLTHGHLATVDVGCMLTIFLAIAVFRWAYVKRSLGRVALCGAVWGVALLVKFTAVLLAPAYLILLVVFNGPRKWRAPLDLLILSLAAVTVVNAGMLFQGSFRPLGGYELKSSFGKASQSLLPPWLPVALPEAYVRGFDAQIADTEEGEMGSYLLGEWRQEGPWYYNLVALAVKLPVPLILMLLLSPWFLARQDLERRELWLILLPPLLLFLAFTLFNRVTVGIRYLLPIVPFLFLAVASLWSSRRPRLANPVAAAVVGYYLVLLLWHHPGYLSFFNLASGGASHGHKLLLDSNIDWGQDLYRLPRFLEEIGHTDKIGLLYFGHVQPQLYGLDYGLVPKTPVPGLLAVSVNYLMGYTYPVTTPDGWMIPVERDHLVWLRSHEPMARLGSIWVFDTRPTAGGGGARSP